MRDAIAQAVAHERTFELEHRVIRADCQVGWTVSRAVPLLDAGGAIVEWFGAASDITARKRVEEARDASEARLAAVFDSTGRVTLSNREMQRYLPTGIDQSRWQATDDEGGPIVPDNYPGARALRGEHVVPGIDMLFAQDDGRPIWTRVAASPVLNEAHEVVGHVAVVTDIDALKRSEEALRENERRLRELAGEFARMVWETEADGMVATDSPSWRACTGQTLDQWLGAGWLDAVHPDDRVFAARQWSEAVAANGMVDAVFRVRRADGCWQPMKVRAAPLLGADGRIRKWVGLNVEIDAGAS